MAVIKIKELKGSSPKSSEEDIKNVLEVAADIIRNIRSMDAKRFTAKGEKK
jgi:flavin-binding protein dodecin